MKIISSNVWGIGNTTCLTNILKNQKIISRLVPENEESFFVCLQEAWGGKLNPVSHRIYSICKKIEKNTDNRGILLLNAIIGHIFIIVIPLLLSFLYYTSMFGNSIFDSKTDLLPLLSDWDHTGVDISLPQNSHKFIDSGLFIYTNRKIRKSIFVPYDHSSGTDIVSNKGFLAIWTDHMILINTHLQNSDDLLCVKSTHANQLQQLNQFLIKIKLQETDVNEILLVGDFNYTDSFFLEKFFCMQKISSTESTTHYNECLDHIFYWNRHNHTPLQNIVTDTVRSHSDHHIISANFDVSKLAGGKG